MATPLARSVLIYGAAFAVAGAAPFVLLPVLTRHLTPAQFGEVTAFLMLSALLANVAGLGAPGFVSVRYFKSSTAEFKGLVATSLLAVCAAHAVAALAFVLLHAPLSTALDMSYSLTMVVPMAALCVSINLVFLVSFQSSAQPMLYLTARVLQATGEVLFCLLWLWLYTSDAGARAFTYTAAVALSTVLALYLSYRRGLVGAGLSLAHLRNLAAMGLPVLPHIVAGSALVYLDRMVVSSVLGTEGLGLYMAAMQISMLMMVLIEPVHRALAPWLFQQLSKKDPGLHRLIVRRTYQLYGVLIIAGVLVAGLAHVLFSSLVDARYAAARPLVGWVVLGYVLQGMYYSVVGYLMYAEKTGRLSLITGSTVVVGVPLSYALTTSLGLQGAGISFALNNALLFVLIWLAASKAVPMPWLLRRA